MSSKGKQPTTSSSAATGGSATAVPEGPSEGELVSQRVANISANIFQIPPGVKLDQLDGTNWATWSGMFEAILQLQEAEDVIHYESLPNGTDPAEWLALQKRVKAYLRLYIQADVYSHIASDIDYDTVATKWRHLQDVYGGRTGTTTIC